MGKKVDQAQKNVRHPCKRHGKKFNQEEAWFPNILPVVW